MEAYTHFYMVMFLSKLRLNVLFCRISELKLVFFLKIFLYRESRSWEDTIGLDDED